jgi:hypothetical protein
MSAAIDQFTTDDADTSGISTRFAQWYRAHASIRRLWAVQNDVGLKVCIALEPTSDGGDALPLWLAMSGAWRSDLQSICECDIQLELVEPDVPSSSDLTDDGLIVAKVDWRESWLYA